MHCQSTGKSKKGCQGSSPGTVEENFDVNEAILFCIRVIGVILIEMAIYFIRHRWMK